MSLLPYALRPRGVLRRYIIRRGVVGGSTYVRPIAMLMVGQGDYVRVRALRHGLILGSTYWRLIGTGLVIQGVHRRITTKPVERIAVQRIRPGHHLQVNVTEPVDLPRRKRRAELRRLEAEALASVQVSSLRS